MGEPTTASINADQPPFDGNRWAAGLPGRDPLAGVAHARDAVARLEAASLLDTLDWALGHGPDSASGTRHDAALMDLVHDIPLAGEGAPLVREDAIVEFAAATGMSDTQARSWIGDALELAYRLPETFARLVQESLPVWKARHIATASRPLTVEGAAWLDRRVALRFEKVGHTRLQRLLTDALVRFDPDEAARRAEAAAETRGAAVYPTESIAGQADGLADLVARVDLPDGLDFDHALTRVAEEQRLAGSEESLDIRRAKAVGIIARRILHGEPATTSSTTPGTAGDLTLYIHLNAHPDSSLPEFARVESPEALVPVTRVKEWAAGASKVIVRPVIDLNTEIARNSYVPSATQREQAILTNPTCVHPYCSKRATRADLDHINPFQTNGPLTCHRFPGHLS